MIKEYLVSKNSYELHLNPSRMINLLLITKRDMVFQQVRFVWRHHSEFFCDSTFVYIADLVEKAKNSISRTF